MYMRKKIDNNETNEDIDTIKIDANFIRVKFPGSDLKIVNRIKSAIDSLDVDGLKTRISQASFVSYSLFLKYNPVIIDIKNFDKSDINGGVLNGNEEREREGKREKRESRTIKKRKRTKRSKPYIEIF